MAQSHLESALRSLVSEHGLERVKRCLHEVENSDQLSEPRQYGTEPLTSTATKKTRASRAKLTAPEYVAKMDLPPGKQSLIGELAIRFHDKSFLPSFGDIANFCHAHEMNVPASKTRVNSVPRVFRCLARMEDDEIYRIINDELFSGPSRLGPIADAIRRNGRSNSTITTNTEKP